MKLQEFEPIIEVPFKANGKQKKIKIKKINQSTLERIAEELEDDRPEKSDELQELEDLQLDLMFLSKELFSSDVTAERVGELREEQKEIKKRIRELKKETKDEAKAQREYSDKVYKELCMEIADGNKETVKFFEENIQDGKWEELYKTLLNVFKEYDKAFLDD